MERRLFLQLVGATLVAPFVAKVSPVLAASEPTSGVVSFAEQLGYKLYPAQKLVLKLLAGETPSTDYISPSANLIPLGRDFCTEAAYLHRLQERGFYNGGTNPSRVLVWGGRRSGMTTLSKIIALYDLKRANQERQNMMTVGHFTAYVDQLHTLKPTLKELEAISQVYSEKAYPNTTTFYQKGELPKRLLTRSVGTNLAWTKCRGIQFQTAVLDMAGDYPEDRVSDFNDSVFNGRLLMLHTGRRMSQDFANMATSLFFSDHPVLEISARMMHPALMDYPRSDLDDVGLFETSLNSLG